MAVFFWYFIKKLFVQFRLTVYHANTGQITLYKVPETHRAIYVQLVTLLLLIYMIYNDTLSIDEFA